MTPSEAIRHIRDWLNGKTHRRFIPSGSVIFRRYEQFEADLPDLCAEYQQVRAELTFLDYLNLVRSWLLANR